MPYKYISMYFPYANSIEMDQNCAPVVTTTPYLRESVGTVRLKCGAISFQLFPAVDRVLTLGS